MNQALHSNEQGIGEESDRVNELVENYMKKNTELYDTETLIPVRNPLHGCYKIFLCNVVSAHLKNMDVVESGH